MPLYNRQEPLYDRQEPLYDRQEPPFYRQEPPYDRQEPPIIIYFTTFNSGLTKRTGFSTFVLSDAPRVRVQ